MKAPAGMRPRSAIQADIAHTLIGERQPTLGEQQGGANFVAVNVHAYVRGGVSITLERPAVHLLASHNILSIESLPLEKQCCEEEA